MVISARSEDLRKLADDMARGVAAGRIPWGMRESNDFDRDVRLLLRRLHQTLDELPKSRDVR